MKNQVTELSKNNPYYLPKHRYLELKHHALQYPEWKKQLNSISLIRECKDPTYEAVSLREELIKRIDLIEQCAKDTDSELWTYILRGVTTETTYQSLNLLHNMPCSRSTYYDRYRRFFWILDKFR